MNEKRRQDLRKIQERISKAVGDVDNRALVRAIDALKTHTRTLENVNEPNAADLEFIRRLDILIERYSKGTIAQAELLDDLKKAIEGIDIPKEVAVSNLPKPVDKVEVKNFPEEVEIKRPKWWKDQNPNDITEPLKEVILEGLREVLKQNREVGRVRVVNSSPKEAVAVRLVNREGKQFYEAIMTAVAGSGSSPSFKDSGNNSQRALVDNDGHVQVDVLSSVTPTGIATEAKQDDIITELQVINSLIPAEYDYISLSYTGSNLTGVVFKTGGSGGTTVSTLTLAYTGSRLDSVTKT